MHLRYSSAGYKLTAGQTNVPVHQWIHTAKVLRDKAGVTEPEIYFQRLFWSSFPSLHPGKYAEMLGKNESTM